MRYQAGLALAFLFLASSGSVMLAQTAPQVSQTPSFSTHSSLVVVPALVRSKSGSLVYTLMADDFLLTDDGVPQMLTLEQDTGGEPLALVVAIEVGGAGAREFNKYSSIAPPLAPMLASIVGNVPHKVAVVTFDSTPALLQGFTSDTAAAADAIQTLMPGCTRQHHLMNCASPLAIHDVGLGDNGAAILDTLGFSVDLLRDQPRQYRRAILLISETLDRGSHLKMEEALRMVSDTNTTIYSIGYSTGKSEAAHYAARELPTQPGELGLENHHPNPQNGCMGRDPDPDPDATHNKAIQAYDCLTQLAPPLALAKMAAIEATDGLKRNVPETVARLTGGEYFKLTDMKSLERSLAAISNHIPNRYVLSFQPQSPSPGLHEISLHLRNYSKLQVTARSSYWADVETTPAN
ncbi:VWA domain-containing protein [Tunturiibacter empetritectus]|uniref:VWFA-related protein n=1 Tax=Tunturiibacter lichenicola TaxID=2051959 RepID=A0A852VLT4_9BACT|nr:VWA domain-containing protein [Edaphobacter lichenicola]NYF90516.1 VWFA-related protein [Edaphobacter lichenicola]